MHQICTQFSLLALLLTVGHIQHTQTGLGNAVMCRGTQSGMKHMHTRTAASTATAGQAACTLSSMLQSKLLKTLKRQPLQKHRDEEASKGVG